MKENNALKSSEKFVGPAPRDGFCRKLLSLENNATVARAFRARHGNGSERGTCLFLRRYPKSLGVDFRKLPLDSLRTYIARYRISARPATRASQFSLSIPLSLFISLFSRARERQHPLALGEGGRVGKFLIACNRKGKSAPRRREQPHVGYRVQNYRSFVEHTHTHELGLAGRECGISRNCFLGVSPQPARNLSQRLDRPLASQLELAVLVARHFEAQPVDEEAIIARFFEHLDGSRFRVSFREREREREIIHFLRGGARGK